MKSKILKKITPEVLIQTIVEIRFIASIPTDAVFGMIYSKLKDKYPTLINSNILQLPPQIRNSDPKLRYQAHHTIYNEKVSVGIGPSVMVFNCINGYIGWKEYFPIIKEELSVLLNLSIIKTVQRIGLRYMSFFEGQKELFENVRMNISFEDDRYKLEQTNVRTEVRLGSARQFKATLQLSDKAIIEIDDNNNEGGLVDIDVAYEIPFSPDLDKLSETIDKIHSEEKALFQHLLKEEFLAQYNPEYDE